MDRSPLDIDWVRAQFPGLRQDFVFLDNAGGSQILGRVVERISDFLIGSNVQLGASYAVSRLASERVEAGVRAAARILNAETPAEIVMGSSTTQLLANLAQAMAPTLRPGDEIVVTDADHESNIGPWRRLAERGVGIRTWPLREESLSLDFADLEPLLNERTRLVCFTHCSNILGGIHPVREWTRRIHERGARVCVDGVAYAPHRRVDVREWGVDYYAFSWYKVFGAHHAVLYARRDALLGLANINHEFLSSPGQDAGPYKLQPGKFSFELVYGVAGVLDYFEELGGLRPAFEAIAGQEERLAERLLGYLRGHPRLRILGDPSSSRERRVATISFAAPARRASEFMPALDAGRFGVRFGHFYSRRLIERLGLAELDGVIRVSMAHYNTLSELDRLIEALDRLF